MTVHCVQARGCERLVRRLGGYATLDVEEAQALANSMWKECRFAPHEHLGLARRPAEGLFVLQSGIACRYRMASDGRRQIVGFLVPGDVCNLRASLLRSVDHSTCALKKVCAAQIRVDAATTLLERYPRVSRALWWMTTVEDSITREWLINVGCRSAFERLAHLLCELFWRLEAVGLARDNQCDLPLTQVELGDALALTSVHVNRTLMEMRRARLISLERGRLELINRRALEAAAEFDPHYLYLGTGDPSLSAAA